MKRFLRDIKCSLSIVLGLVILLFPVLVVVSLAKIIIQHYTIKLAFMVSAGTLLMVIGVIEVIQLIMIILYNSNIKLWDCIHESYKNTHKLRYRLFDIKPIVEMIERA
jgi:hypothetical protein